MLIHYYQPGDIAIFCDTEKEAPGTHEFLDNIEKFEGIPIVRLKYPGGWLRLIKTRATVPNKFKRKCTEELKIKTARRYLRSIGLFSYDQFLGFRADEPKRVEDYKENWEAVDTYFPMFDDGVTKPMVREFFTGYKYDLDIPEILGNCDLCFLKGIEVIIKIISNAPHLADKWIEEEESDKNGHTFHAGITMRQLKQIAIERGPQPIEGLTPQYTCSCTAY